VYSLVLKPLPYNEPERIVELYTSATKLGLNHIPANVTCYLDYSQNAESYETIGLWRTFKGRFGDDEAPMLLMGARASAEMFLLVAFAGLALFLSALGIYSVLAYDVSQRTREIGIRGALGATREQIVMLIIKQGLWKVGTGLVAGLIGAAVLSRYMTSLLFGVKPSDPIVYLSVSLLLFVVALLASYLPAKRAAKIDPMEALRAE